MDMMMMMKKIFSLVFFCTFISAENFYFSVPDEKQSAQILNLKASAKANKIIRDNAYLGFGEMDFDPNSCWQEFIKNRKIKIKSSESYHKLFNKTSNDFIYILKLNPKKINIANVSKKEFIQFCSLTES